MSKLEAENVRVRDAWDTNARFWDERMADGNVFFNALVWPGVEHLLRPQPSEVLLDAACGNEETAQNAQTTDAGTEPGKTTVTVETGRKYRQAILEAGGSRPAMESFKAFRGREPSIDALLRHQGMA